MSNYEEDRRKRNREKSDREKRGIVRVEMLDCHIIVSELKRYHYMMTVSTSRTYRLTKAEFYNIIRVL